MFFLLDSNFVYFKVETSKIFKKPKVQCKKMKLQQRKLLGN